MYGYFSIHVTDELLIPWVSKKLKETNLFTETGYSHGYLTFRPTSETLSVAQINRDAAWKQIVDNLGADHKSVGAGTVGLACHDGVRLIKLYDDLRFDEVDLTPVCLTHHRTIDDVIPYLNFHVDRLCNYRPLKIKCPHCWKVVNPEAHSVNADRSCGPVVYRRNAQDTVFVDWEDWDQQVLQFSYRCPECDAELSDTSGGLYSLKTAPRSTLIPVAGNKSSHWLFVTYTVSLSGRPTITEVSMFRNHRARPIKLTDSIEAAILDGLCGSLEENQ